MCTGVGRCRGGKDRGVEEDKEVQESGVAEEDGGMERGAVVENWRDGGRCGGGH